MEINNKLLISIILLTLILTFYTLFNINIFMQSEKKCESAFAVINKCNCVPDKYLDKLFKVKCDINSSVNEYNQRVCYPTTDINLSNEN